MESSNHAITQSQLSRCRVIAESRSKSVTESQIRGAIESLSYNITVSARCRGVVKLRSRVVVVSSCHGVVELRVDDEFENGGGVKRRR